MQNEKRLGAGRKQGASNTVIEPVTVSILKKGDPRLVASLLKLMRKKTPVQRKNESSGAFVARREQWSKDRLNAAIAAAPYIHPLVEVWEITTPGLKWRVREQRRMRLVGILSLCASATPTAVGAESHPQIPWGHTHKEPD